MDAGNGKREARTPERPAIRSYEDIEAYQRAMDLLVPLHAAIRLFPDYERYELASQLRRASKSIPANIAEGYGKKTSTKDFKNYLNHALGSANEVVVHLKIAEALGYVDGAAVSELAGGYTIIAKQLHRLGQNWQSFGDSGIPLPVSRISHPDEPRESQRSRP